MVHPDLLLLLPSLALPDDRQDGHPVGCGEVGPGRSGMVSCNAVGEADPKSIDCPYFPVTFVCRSMCTYIYYYIVYYIYYNINDYVYYVYIYVCVCICIYI